MKNIKNNKKYIVITILILLFIFIGIGYSYLSTNLSFNSKVQLKKAGKCFFITNAVDKVKCLSEDDTTNLVADDGTLDHNIRYIGANPNNYVTFNDELWRIIGVMNNIDDGTGKKESRIKLIRSASIGTYSWNTKSGDTRWDEAILQKELNTDYLGNITIGTEGNWYHGVDKNLTMPTTSLLIKSQQMIDNAVWSLGNNEPTDNEKMASNFYTYERRTNHDPWTGKVGLMYPSDYGFATSGSDSVSRDKCLNEQLSTTGTDWTDVNWNPMDCAINDWLRDPYINSWTIYNNSDNWGVRPIDHCGNITSHNMENIFDVRPVVFLKSSIKIISGKGIISKPFELSL